MLYVFLFYRPNTGVSPFEEDKNDLLQKYEEISLLEAGKINTDRGAGVGMALSMFMLENGLNLAKYFFLRI